MNKAEQFHVNEDSKFNALQYTMLIKHARVHT